MRIYIAASFGNRTGAKAAREILELHGHTVTSRWIDSHYTPKTPLTDAQKATEAEIDYSDIRAADAVLFLNTPELPSTSGGQHLEMGYAIARHLPVYLLGPLTSVFHAHPTVTPIARVEDIP